MPITSYLAHPLEGKKTELIKALASFKECDVIPAENKEVLVVVTETENTEEENILKDKIEAIDSLKFLALVSGFNTPKKD